MKLTWVWTAFWNALYFVILVAMAIIWRPTSNNTRYAYTEMSPEGEEITLQPLNVISDAIQRKPKEGDSEVPTSKTNTATQDSKSLAEISVAFSIDDDEKDTDMKME